jgi:hypothetical protein
VRDVEDHTRADRLTHCRHEGPTALVTVGEGKFYSNGLDLDYLGSHTDQVEAFMNQYARPHTS